MSLFLDLPEALCREILLEWVTFLELGLLDIAYCSSTWRQYNLNNLRVGYPKFRSTSQVANFHEWIYTRGLVLTELVLNDISAEILDYIRPQDVKSLLLLYFFDINLKPFVNQCVNLKSFHSKKFPLASLDSSILEGLNSVTMTATVEDLRVLLNCSNLHTVKLGHREVDSGLFALILERNPHFIELEVVPDSVILNAIVKYCSSTLRVLSLTTADIFNDFNHGFEFLTMLPRLETVSSSAYRFKYKRSENRLSFYDAHGLDMSGWELFLQIIPGLVKTSVRTIDDLTSETFRAVFRYHGATLRDVRIESEADYVLEVSAESLSYIFRQCPNLEILEIAEISFKEAVLHSVFSEPNKLKRLSIGDFCDARGLISIIKSSPAAETIKFTLVADSERVTEWIMAIVIAKIIIKKQIPEIILVFEDSDDDTTSRLIYNNGEFSGEIWDESQTEILAIINGVNRTIRNW